MGDCHPSLSQHLLITSPLNSLPRRRKLPPTPNMKFSTILPLASLLLSSPATSLPPESCDGSSIITSRQQPSSNDSLPLLTSVFSGEIHTTNDLGPIAIIGGERQREQPVPKPSFIQNPCALSNEQYCIDSSFSVRKSPRCNPRRPKRLILQRHRPWRVGLSSRLLPRRSSTNRVGALWNDRYASAILHASMEKDEWDGASWLFAGGECCGILVVGGEL